ncbi:unnamed protein product [Mytilus coruscus]|uniref:DUF659 domain-containing protein n=1 Tax=Mytilus coruscus TaxID=42192 RepID=A0A6J8C1R3_MYTCO|nr:unnamed protein product [Mytilus coruscus]
MNDLFRNAHATAKHHLAFRVYPVLCQLDKAKDLDFGETYLNDKKPENLFIILPMCREMTFINSWMPLNLLVLLVIIKKYNSKFLGEFHTLIEYYSTETKDTYCGHKQVAPADFNSCVVEEGALKAYRQQLLMMRKKKNIEEKEKSEMKSCKNVSITQDGWKSCNTESYSCVTAHLITNQWELVNAVLQTKKVKWFHTGENIANALTEVKDQWSLPDIIAVTDNAAKQKKAFQILNWIRFGYYGHRINLVVKNALSVSKEISHSTSANDNLMTKQKLLLQEEYVGNKLIMDVPTRWNCNFAMLRCLLEHTQAVIALTADSSETLRLHWLQLKDMLTALKIKVLKKVVKTEPTEDNPPPALPSLPSVSDPTDDDTVVQVEKCESAQTCQRTAVYITGTGEQDTDGTVDMTVTKQDSDGTADITGIGKPGLGGTTGEHFLEDTQGTMEVHTLDTSVNPQANTVASKIDMQGDP